MFSFSESDMIGRFFLVAAVLGVIVLIGVAVFVLL
jgi:hypothetical protein